MEKTETIELIKFLEDMNCYEFLQEIPGRGICGLQRFIYTVGLVYGLDKIGYEGRYCFPLEKAQQAVIALQLWDGKNDPPFGWIKHKGRVGEYGNPNI